MSGEGNKDIVPPHVLSATAENGSPKQRRWAREVLATDVRSKKGRAAGPKAGASGTRDAGDRSGESRGEGGTP